MNEKNIEIEKITASVFEPIKYTGLEKGLSLLGILLFSFVLIVGVFFPEFILAFRNYFGFLFALSCFCVIVVDISAARRTGLIKMRNLIVSKKSQPFLFGLTYILKLIISLACVGLVWFFIST